MAAKRPEIDRLEIVSWLRTNRLRHDLRWSWASLRSRWRREHAVRSCANGNRVVRRFLLARPEAAERHRVRGLGERTWKVHAASVQRWRTLGKTGAPRLSAR